MQLNISVKSFIVYSSRVFDSMNSAVKHIYFWCHNVTICVKWKEYLFIYIREETTYLLMYRVCVFLCILHDMAWRHIDFLKNTLCKLIGTIVRDKVLFIMYCYLGFCIAVLLFKLVNVIFQLLWFVAIAVEATGILR